MSPPAVTDIPQTDGDIANFVSTNLKDAQNAKGKGSNEHLIKFFAIMSDNRKLPLGFIKVDSTLTLFELRKEMSLQMDFPPFLLPTQQAQQSNGEEEVEEEEEEEEEEETTKSVDKKRKRETLWEDVSYSFLFESLPVSQKQERELKVPQDYPSLEVSVSAFPELISLKYAENEAKKTKELKNKELPFKVVVKDLVSCKTNKVIGQEKILHFENTNTQISGPYTHAQLCQLLRNGTQNPAFYNKEPSVKQDNMLFHLQKLKDLAKTSEQAKVLLKPVLEYLEGEYGDTIKAIETMISNNQITFNYLWYLFPKDSKFSGYIHGEPVGSSVIDHRYQQSFFGASFAISGNLIKSNGATLNTITKWFAIEEFEGLKEIKDLPLQPLTDEKYQKLVNRGKIFRDNAIGAHYLQYTGNMGYQNWCMMQKFKADGRIMVDTISFNRFNPNYGTFRFSTEEDFKGIDTIADEKLYMTWPTIPGFSFSAKKWGEFIVSNLSPVVFASDAFDKLVLDNEKKRLIKCLVQNSSKTFTDLISGKGGGVIFLCHGPPGVGKTLTAEAVSELLQRPLYCVNIGELGVTTTQLEEKLSQILEVASTWNAIILLDEADIFLERRTDNDIERNALVGIFLRLLEYHQGVMFLTTNRVKSFDEAFHSRISIALHYQALDQTARKQIWENLLSSAKIEAQLDCEELSQYELNGRQIKNIIRLAQTIAHEENKPVNHIDIAKCVEVAKQFQEDLSSKN